MQFTESIVFYTTNQWCSDNESDIYVECEMDSHKCYMKIYILCVCYSYLNLMVEWYVEYNYGHIIISDS